jgi:hypothetical protein
MLRSKIELAIILCTIISTTMAQGQDRNRVNLGREGRTQVQQRAALRIHTALRPGQWQVLGPGGGGAQFNPSVSPLDPNLVLENCDMTGAYLSIDGGDSWRMLNLRGVVRFFAFDPGNVDILYAYSLGLWKSSDRGKSWELLFPSPCQVDRVVISGDHGDEWIQTKDGTTTSMEALSVDPADSSRLYAVMNRDGNAFLSLSTDGGLTWRGSDPLPGGGRKILVNPASPIQERTLYVAGVNSVSIRENGTWRHPRGPDGVNSFNDVTAGFPPEGGKPVIYGISGISWQGGNSGVTGLFISEDGGGSWRKADVNFLSPAPPASAQIELRAIGCCPTQPHFIYLSFRDHTPSLPDSERGMGVARSSDRGNTWIMVWKDTDAQAAANVRDPWITERFGPGWGENPFSLGIAPTNPDICFGTDFGRTMRTRDGGKMWEGIYAYRFPDGCVTTSGLDVTTCYGIHFDPFDWNHLFISYTDIGLFESRNGGLSWQSATRKGVPPEWVNTTYWLSFDPEVKGRIWAVMSGIHDLPRPKMWRNRSVSTYNGGVLVSEDGGQTWNSYRELMGQTAATHILLDPASSPSGRTLYVAGFGKGVFKTSNGGKTWSLKNNGLEGKEPFAWRFAQDRERRLYLVVARRSDNGSIHNSLDGALYVSVDGAEHWEKLALPANCNGPNGLAIDPVDSNRLYLAAWGRTIPQGAAGGGIFLSTDAGKSWRSMLEKDQYIYDVTIDPEDPQILYASGFQSSVWKSTDQGETWRRVQGFNFKWGHRVFPDPVDRTRIFVTTFGGSLWHGPANGDAEALEDIITPALKPGF